MAPPLRGIPRYTLSVRPPGQDRGGAVEPAHGDDLAHAGRRHLLLLVHGFNNTATQAQQSYDRMVDGHLLPLMAAMRTPPDGIVSFQWPGDAAVIAALAASDTAGYPVDIERARQAAAELQGYLTTLQAASGGALKLSLIGHSLGCRLVLEMLRGFAGGPSPFEVVALMAGAVPVDLVDAGYSGAGGPSLLAAADAARQVLKFHSWLDAVLGIGFPAGQALAFELGIERGCYLEAVGYWGDPAGFGQSMPTTYDTHSGYWDDDDVAFQILAAIDPTLRRLPPTAAAPARPLPPATAITARDLPQSRYFGG